MDLNAAYQNKTRTNIQGVITDTVPNMGTLLCLSHLRWNFVYQRPQHLMTRFAAKYNVLYIEESIYTDEVRSYLSIHKTKERVSILVPHIPANIGKEQEKVILLDLVKDFLLNNNYHISIKWYQTPMMLGWSKFLISDIMVYDCMDELSAFKDAPTDLKEFEAELIENADLIFTGGESLFKVKSRFHNDVHLFPSSVDISHFLKSRGDLPIPSDQKFIPQPRIGFYGVVDERFDIKLLNSLALCRPDWSFIIIGPVVKIDVKDLPQYPNIYYLGAKTYEELPYYLSGWDVAFIPFAINEATKFISPTKTPEYLAAGKPVVSTPIADIVNTYQNSDIVHIADPEDILAFTNAIELALEDSKDKQRIYQKAEIILQDMSWDKTFSHMHDLILIKQDEVADNAG